MSPPFLFLLFLPFPNFVPLFNSQQTFLLEFEAIHAANLCWGSFHRADTNQNFACQAWQTFLESTAPTATQCSFLSQQTN